MPVDEEVYVKSFKPEMMEVVYQWTQVPHWIDSRMGLY